MSRTVLTPDEMEQLANVIAKQNPALEPLLQKLGVVLLSRDEREALREAIADELVESGLDNDSEPNKFGLFLESLIERLWYYSVDWDEV